MSLADDPFDRLWTLSPRDRRAVLARLTPVERRRVDAARREPVSPFAPDITARIAAPGEAMTDAGRAVVARITGATVPPSQAPGPSLLARLRSAIGGR